jgi:hypothetical protein
VAPVGTRTTGGHEGVWVQVGPGWQGRLPEGVHRIQSPTLHVWVAGQILVESPEEVAEVRKIYVCSTLALLSRFEKANWKCTLMFDPSQCGDSYEQLDERAAYFYEAVGASPAMVTKPSGVGSAYLGSYRDKTGAPLDCASTFRLRVPPNPPMKQLAGGQHSTL